MVIHYIGADVHCNNTELAVEQKGRIVRRYSVATTVRAIRDALDEIGGTRHLALEEGPLAGWLYRNLVDQVDTLVVCNPRRNKLIAEDDGDKDDPIDAAKLATLLRGGYLRPVYHSRDEDRVRFKEWVALYHDRVEAATRGINQIRACGRLHGIAIPRRVLRDAQARETWLGSLESEDLAEQFRMVWMSYETAAVQVQHTRTRLRDLRGRIPSSATGPRFRGWDGFGRSPCSPIWTRHGGFVRKTSSGSIAGWAYSEPPADAMPRGDLGRPN